MKKKFEKNNFFIYLFEKIELIKSKIMNIMKIMKILKKFKK